MQMIVNFESMHDMRRVMLGGRGGEGGLLVLHQHQQHLSYMDRLKARLASGRNSAQLRKHFLHELITYVPGKNIKPDTNGQPQPDIVHHQQSLLQDSTTITTLDRQLSL